MSEKHPDFTDVFYAKARARAAAKKGLAQAEAGDKKAARAFYAEAVKWSKEAERYEKLLAKKQPAARSSSRAQGRPPPRPGEDLSASRSPRRPSPEHGAQRRGKSRRGK